MLSALDIIIIAIIQGISEWLPISSQDKIFYLLTSFSQVQQTYAVQISIFLHFGTALAALVYFRYDIIKLLKIKKNIQNKNDFFFFVLITTIISLFLGAFVYIIAGDMQIKYASFSFLFIGVILIVLGIMNYDKRKDSKIRIKDSLIIGTVQALSLIPSLSRSGLTISFLLLLGYNAKQAIRYSFILSIPFVLIGGIFFLVNTNFNISFSFIILGIAICFIAGLLTINFLFKLAEKISYSLFCVLLGVIAIIFSVI